MAYSWRFSIPTALLAALLLGLGAGAQEATPAATPAPFGPEDCTVAPRPTAELRALLLDYLPEIRAFVAGTPSGGGGGGRRDTPAVVGPVDAATVAAVTEPIRQSLACAAAGNLPALVSTLTDEGAGQRLALAFVAYEQATTGTVGGPTAEADPVVLDAWLASIAVPVPLPADRRVTLYEVHDVVRLDDGRVRATARLATGSEEPDENRVVLREVDGGFRVVFGNESDDGAEATPAATPAA